MRAARKLEPTVDDPVLAALLAAPLDPDPLTEEERAEVDAAIARVQRGERGIPGDVVSAEIAAMAR